LISILWIKYWCVALLLSISFLHISWRWAFSHESQYGVNFDSAFLKHQHFSKRFHASGIPGGMSELALREIELVLFASCPDDCSPDSAHYDQCLEQKKNEAIVTLKSAALFSRRNIHFHIFTDDYLYPLLIKEVDLWPYKILHRVSFTFHPIIFRDMKFQINFLYLPAVLPNINLAIIVKSGTVFIDAVDDLWIYLRHQSEPGVASAFINSKLLTSCTSCYQPENHLHTYDTNVILFNFFKLRQVVFQMPDSPVNISSPSSPTSSDHMLQRVAYSPILLDTFSKMYNIHGPRSEEALFNLIMLFNRGKVDALPDDMQGIIDNTDCAINNVLRTSTINFIATKAGDKSKILCKNSNSLYNILVSLILGSDLSYSENFQNEARKIKLLSYFRT